MDKKKKKLNVGIVGYRKYTNYDQFQKLVDDLKLDTGLIVSGGCVGTDTMAEIYAHKKGIPLIVHKPDWDKHTSKKAYLERNSLIVNDSDYLIAFLSPQSRGTQDSIRKAKLKNIPIKIYNI